MIVALHDREHDRQHEKVVAAYFRDLGQDRAGTMRQTTRQSPRRQSQAGAGFPFSGAE